MAVPRINFVEEKKWELTYRSLGLLIISWIGFLGLLALFQTALFFYTQWQNRSVAEEITRLKSEKEKVLSVMETRSLSRPLGPGYSAVYAIFERRIQWSPFLSALSQKIPPRLWLTEINSTGKETQGDSPKSDSLKGDSPKGGQKSLTLTGFTYQSSTISQFLRELSEIKNLGNISLVSSERGEKEGFRFTIKSDLSP
ncbi:MAG: PilN domain-containing protein [Deltaproteobacteria bacterium]|nr:PilN domain-containing protein [Deltaproteobacteria bacterium]